MGMCRRKGTFGVVHVFFLALAVLHAAGCSDAASKASSKQPAFNLLGIFPADGAASIPTNTAITAVFNQEIDTSTVTDSTFIVRSNNRTVAYVPSYSSMRAQFKPTTELAANTEYSVEITAVVKSRGGQLLDKPIIWKFTTGPVVDSSAPSIVDTQPAADATNVPTNARIIASFNERINITAVSDANFSVKRGDTVVAGTLKVSESTLSFSPSVTLTEEATYTVNVQGVLDIAGNALAAAKAWSFTVGKTPDKIAPALVLSSPPGGTDNLPAVFSATLLFSEPLDSSTVTPSTVALATSSSAVVFTAANYNPGNNSIVVTAQKNLSYGAIYTLTLDGVTDAAGNRLVLTTLSFKTEPDADADLVPDSWEKLKGTDPAIADGDADPDLDKLTNLEEFRHGTDPKNPDTDGDGTGDGDEVTRGRNPLANEPAVLAIITDLILND